MTPERWKRIDALYHAALERPVEVRWAFLDAACEGDEDARREVEALLESDAVKDGFFSRPALHVAASLARHDSQSESLVGRSIGAYQVISFVASGGMGHVYRARHSKLGRDVALKVLPAEVSQDPERLHRSEREAKLLASLSHPNIAAIYDLVDTAGIPCLVLEYVDGQTLAERLKQRGRLPLEEALDIARQIAEGLEAAHERGIIHRDLKPANVMIAADGGVKILDFGIARIVGSDSSPQRGVTLESWTTSIVSGTPSYMSPEQVKGHPVNRNADIWAFGCVLYEMLAGRRAFDGNSVVEILGRVTQTEPDWAAFRFETPSVIYRLLQRCLRRDPRRRLQNIGDARIEIEEVQNGPETEPLPQRTGKKKRLAWITALLLVGLIAGVAGFVLRTAPTQPTEMRLEITAPPTTLAEALAISPDGQKVVFSATVAGEMRLWLRELNSQSARPLVGTDGAEYPFWSPDSRSIGFFADGKLKRIDVDGGVPQVLANAPFPKGGTWSRHGVILFTPNNSGPVYRISAMGGEANAVTKPDESGVSNRLPKFLPDGRHFLYSTLTTVFVATVDGGETRRLVDARVAECSPAGYLIWQRGTTLFAQSFDVNGFLLFGDISQLADHVPTEAWSVSAAGPIIYRTASVTQGIERQLAWFDRSGKLLREVGDRSVNADMGLSMSPDGQQLAVARNPSAGTWLLDLQRGALSPFTRPSFHAVYPVWSPDGRRIVFGHVEQPTVMELYQKTTDGAGTEQLLLSTTLNKAATDWSTDGRFLLYRSPDPKTGFDIWALPMNGDKKAFPVAQTEADERDGQFSPDGKWIAYQSNESGRFEIYVQPFPGPGVKKPISTNGGSQVRWRSDGRELFYIALDGRLMSVPIRFSLDGKGIEPGVPVPLFPSHAGNVVQVPRQQYVVSPDGQGFLINTVTETGNSSPITVILNYKPKS